jgi:hypothetical protein
MVIVIVFWWQRIMLLNFETLFVWIPVFKWFINGSLLIHQCFVDAMINMAVMELENAKSLISEFSLWNTNWESTRGILLQNIFRKFFLRRVKFEILIHAFLAYFVMEIRQNPFLPLSCFYLLSFLSLFIHYSCLFLFSILCLLFLRSFVLRTSLACLICLMTHQFRQELCLSPLHIL